MDRVSVLSVCGRAQHRAQDLTDDTRAALATSTHAASDSDICFSDVCMAVFLLRKSAFKLMVASAHQAMSFLASMSPLYQ
jgi:hypothetical protein